MVILYVMDSLRRDFLGCYGDAGAFTPHLDAFAAGATRYTNSYALAPWSKASGAAMFTGQLPRALGMRQLHDRLPDNVATVAESFGARGYRTAAITANPFISHDFGMLRGFDETVEAFRPGALPREHFQFHRNHFARLAELLSIDPAALVLARSEALHGVVTDFLATDTFLLIWSMDTHAPFFVRGERSRFGNPLDRVVPAADAEWLTGGLTARDLAALYRDMIAYNDEQFGALAAELKRRGLWDEATVIVTGDHGEAFGEHGVMGHTSGLWEEQIAVPLLVKAAGQQRGAVVDRLTGLTALPDLLIGERTEEAEPTPLYIESPEGWTLRSGAYKLLAARDDTAPLLFNLDSDPDERAPLRDNTLAQALMREAMAIREEADAKASQWESPVTPELDPRLVERLRGLGYW